MMKQNDKKLMVWQKMIKKALILTTVFLGFSLTIANAQTPCIPESEDNGDEILNFSLAEFSHDSEPSSSEDGYSDFTDLNPIEISTSLDYVASITSGGGSSSHGAAIWIDFNDDGVLAEEEKVAFLPNEISSNETVQFPDFSVEEPGTHLLRVQYTYNQDGADLDPCDPGTNYSETEDYMIEITESEVCDEVVAGEVENITVCPDEVFTLETDGVTAGIAGLSYQWEESEDNDNWTDIEGADSHTYTVENGIDQPMFYRLTVSCENGNENTSDAIEVSFKPGDECYCEPEFTIGCFLGDEITNVTLEGESENINNDTECNLDNDATYSYFTDITPPDLELGETYTISVSTEYQYPESQEARAWIDYDGNGVFADDEEIANTNGNGFEAGGTVEFDFTVPEDVQFGEYRMRVRIVSNGGDDIDPCETESYGETQDYNVELLEPPTCLRPSNVTVSYESETLAQISWEPNNEETEWEVIYGESGFDPAENGTLITVEDEPVTIIEGLEESTDYEVYVRAICSDDDGSNLTAPKAFTTFDTPLENNYLCDATPLTFNDDCANGPYTNEGTFEEVNEPVGSCLTNFHGTNTVWFSFIGSTSGEATITTDFPSTEFNTEIVVFEAPTDCEDLNTLGDEVGCASSSADVELTDLTPGAMYYVKVAGFDNAEGEFCIEVQTDGDTPEPCLAPSDIIVEVGEQSVDVSWTPEGNEDQWTVIYGETGFNPQDEGDTVIVNDTPETTLTDLEPNTDYDVYVMANCEADTTSDLVGPETFNSGDMSVEDYLFEDFTYYPNPVKNQLTLKAGTQIESVTVYNLLGQTVITENPNQLETQLNTESLQGGVYLMKVSLNGSAKTFRIIKK